VLLKKQGEGLHFKRERTLLALAGFGIKRGFRLEFTWEEEGGKGKILSFYFWRKRD